MSGIPQSLEASGEKDAELFDDPDNFDFLKDDFSEEERSELDVALETEKEIKGDAGDPEKPNDDIVDDEAPVEEDPVDDENPPVEGEQEEPGEPGEGEGEELFYDPERDGGVAPNVFKDRVSGNLGLVSKGSYIEKLQAELKELGKDVGAIPLPSLVTSEEEVAEKYSLESVASLSDEEARQAIADSDRFISSLKDKIEREKSAQQTQESISQAEEVLQKSTQEMTALLRKVGYKDEEIAAIKSDEEVFSRIDGQIKDLESQADDIISEQGYTKFREQLSTLQTSRARLQQLADEVVKAMEARPKPEGPKEVTPEQIEAALSEFESDDPSNWIFKDKTGNTLEAMVRTAKTSGWKMATPRDWSQNAEKFRAMVQSMQAKKVATGEDPSKKASGQGSAVKRVAPVVSTAPKAGERIDNYFDRDLDNFMENELLID